MNAGKQVRRVGCAFMVMVSGLLGQAAAADPRPNVLFIVSDDLRTWLGCYGDRQAHTPNLDRLAARGVIFKAAYCGAPLCNPTRTSLLTGMRPSVTGVYGNTILWSKAVPDAMTIPLLFKQNGYYVSGAGKITHAKSVRESDWTDFGPVGNTLTPGKIHVDALQWNIVPENEEKALPDYVLTSYVVERLRQKHDQPFFLACGIHRPHTTWDVPQKYFDLYPLDQIKPSAKAGDLDDVPSIGRQLAHGGAADDAGVRATPQGAEKIIQAYRASVSFMDAQVGRLLDALDASPNRDNTIIVFWGDNGWNHGEKEHWAKAVLWKESTRVPLIWVAPGVTKPGGVCERPVDFLAVFPTLCELTGLPVPEQCKDPSIRSLLINPAAAWDRPALSTMGAGNHAVCDERWRYIRYSDGTEELYDHAADPEEWTNVALNPDYAAVKTRLAKWLPVVDAPDKGPKGKKDDYQ